MKHSRSTFVVGMNRYTETHQEVEKLDPAQDVSYCTYMASCNYSASLGKLKQVFSFNAADAQVRGVTATKSSYIFRRTPI